MHLICLQKREGKLHEATVQLIAMQRFNFGTESVIHFDI